MGGGDNFFSIWGGTAFHGGGQPLDGAGSVAKKVRKGGIGSALRTFFIFGSAFGPHWG